MDNNQHSDTNDATVLFNYRQSLCQVTLNRPKENNSLTIEMIRLLLPEIDKWNHDPNIKVAIFKGAGDENYCCGGDTPSLFDEKLRDTKQDLRRNFFTESYKLDLSLARMNTIQVAFWNGRAFGSGVGVIMYAPIRITTDNSMFGMIEAKIGFFTDSGAAYYFSRLRNNLGLYLGLTGKILVGQEIVQVGLADYYVKRENIQKLEQEIIEHTNKDTKLEEIQAIIKKYEEPVERKYPNEEFINEIFGKNSLEEIYTALKNTTTHKEFAEEIVNTMDSQSAISMHVIFEAIRRGKDLDLAENLKMDMRVVTRFGEGTDFYEGIRIFLFAKDDKPKWSYKSILDVPKEEVEKYFEKLPSNLELMF
jgi:enoyl-CoA hydratase